MENNRGNEHAPTRGALHLSESPRLPLPTSERVLCKVRLFNPTGIGTWWVAAYDPDGHVAWGVAEIHEREIGSFSMDELTEYRGRFGLPIERDLGWKPRSLRDVIGGAR
jgi:Protein of unknown function (DUF2958)